MILSPVNNNLHRTTHRVFSAFKIFPLLMRLHFQTADDDDLNG
jgi:hypothetical protein